MASPKLCSVDGCSKPRHARDFCSTHWWRIKHKGTAEKPSKRKPLPERCSVSDCTAPPERGRKGMCARHYRMVYRRGTTVPALPQYGQVGPWMKAHISFDGDDCLIWPFARGRCGDARMGKRITVAGRPTAQAARAMCALAHGHPPNPEMQAAHKCGRGHHGCVNPRHLEWKTPLDNTRDKIEHGTMLRGECHPMAKLSALQVRAVRLLCGEFTVPELVDLIGAPPRTICDIIDGKGWRCLA